jgi:hypothetical protein
MFCFILPPVIGSGYCFIFAATCVAGEVIATQR